jgi:fused signal recognition particle receptor
MSNQDNLDVLCIDTAGRLQNKEYLMEELRKIVRVIKKHDEDAPQHIFLVLDATNGQNINNQVEIFSKVVNVNGLILTKLDGTAKGGIAVNLAQKHNLPIYAIGVGEKSSDLQEFNANDFAKNMLGID